MRPTNEEFIRLAPIIYGRYWKTDAAKDLGFSTRTIFNWITDMRPADKYAVRILQSYEEKNLRYDRETGSLKKGKGSRQTTEE